MFFGHKYKCIQVHLLMEVYFIREEEGKSLYMHAGEYPISL